MRILLLALTLLTATLWAAGPKPGVDYHLTQFTVDGRDLPLPATGRAITLQFRGPQQLGGQAPVNSYSGRYSLADSGAIEWTGQGFGSTLMAGPPDLMKLEKAYLTALSSTTSLVVEGSRLTLQDQGGSRKLVYEEQAELRPPDHLLGKTLQVKRVVLDGKELTIPERPATLTLGRQNKVSGFAGVNRYNGFSITGAKGQFKFGPLVTTRMAGPQDRMDFETAYLKALAEITTAKATSSTLILENAAQSITIEFVVQ